ncbi:hypothetical protein ASPWEDRAFT_105945 [Aspergillus wentii DTO 134E9]|uniref:Vta1/callose synthase N-terminal domain-containing protein n=1 Tax=Aspergillus wentii DTO 134E9 TaxID=1073089 RepID=A0A1L9RXX9_ASPWE|nr:uncharacterized protein ASPWEDRAFT_105945 [Aspergillus wentii DTO 134E9]KAI9931585.1 hypothetical protein MW887_010162 [Aspergillus wentii]OJJ39744.1 hypothetical protein ASPWEDRAFT_105945 [Aspergillus wentii DTO 134E9]
MASNIPAGLKSADIGRFAVRAAQIERAKPVIAYWCNFWIVNQIIERGLHSTDDEIKLYTTTLVDKLEQFKSENNDNDTVMDNVAASAYVEQFGQEVFNRAEATMKANKVTRQTADTFQAAATFLELCNIWGPPDPEVAAKIKFAKYHALRIAKAIKAGEDPNDSNPVIQEEEKGEFDPDAQIIDEAALRQPSVEDVPDENDSLQRRLAQQSAFDESLHPSRASSIPPQPPAASVRNTAPSPGQNMDIDTEQGPALNLPSAPETIGSLSTQIPDLPDTPANLGVPRSSNPYESFQSFPPPSAQPPSPPAASNDPSSFYNQPSASVPFAQPPKPAPVVQPTPQPARVPVAPPAPAPAYGGPSNSQPLDDNTIALAQKHARWAVSALTFDDVNTAIKELKNSLRHLGAE